jgi:hypothetical protein
MDYGILSQTLRITHHGNLGGFKFGDKLREVHVVVGVVEGQSDVIVDVVAVLDGSVCEKLRQ